MEKAFCYLVERLGSKMILRFWSLHPRLEDDWLEGCSGQEDHSFDDHSDESSSSQVCISDDEQDLQVNW